eukprot:scaffold50030_cov59-Phaeocystis_antarctica.AAC.1
MEGCVVQAAHPLRNFHALSQHNVLHVHIEVVLERTGARAMVAQPGFRADAARHVSAHPP